MDTITIQVPATPVIEQLVAALLQQDGVRVGRKTKTDKLSAFVSLEEGAQLAGVNYHTFRSWVVERHLIPFSRPSGAGQGRIRVKRVDINGLLAGKSAGKRPGRKARGVALI